jgi:hypothetical protein
MQMIAKSALNATRQAIFFINTMPHFITPFHAAPTITMIHFPLAARWGQPPV